MPCKASQRLSSLGFIWCMLEWDNNPIARQAQKLLHYRISIGSAFASVEIAPNGSRKYGSRRSSAPIARYHRRPVSGINPPAHPAVFPILATRCDSGGESSPDMNPRNSGPLLELSPLSSATDLASYKNPVAPCACRSRSCDIESDFDNFLLSSIGTSTL